MDTETFGFEPHVDVNDIVRLITGTSKIKIVEVHYFTSEEPLQPYDRHGYHYNRYSRCRDKKRSLFVGWAVKYQYVSEKRSFTSCENAMIRGWRPMEDFVLIEERKDTNLSKLYQTKDAKPRFGTYLTKNSQGQMVLEMKGESGKVEAFDPEHLEKVTPHTVSLCLRGSGKAEHFEIPAGKLKNGQVLICRDGQLWNVECVDTKHDGARDPSNYKFFILEGELLNLDTK